MYTRFFKRFIDFIGALLILLFASPILLVSSLLLFFANSGKIFFVQKRPGLNSEIFKIIKFKTMNDKRDSNGELLPDDKRLTKIGYWVRKLSIDELPQMINVLKGDMSLVGPRPLLVDYLALYSDEQNRRHDLRPGITGWAQINGRNTLEWKKKFEYDVWYVDNCSFWLDIKILFLTVAKVFKTEGISSEKSVTMERFLGNDESV
ncbi:sugar transferase [uncultured Roseivirga sp.]|uniref:sugar transferase n=1 Tax=uncultured Roseivirga sp. TaxID=543088 RepID=UPI0030D6E846|tara:strand:- start:108259 stop:108873 length:615 start_codon:yes stop_codon:yes gene_type:complete